MEPHHPHNERGVDGSTGTFNDGSTVTTIEQSIEKITETSTDGSTETSTHVSPSTSPSSQIEMSVSEDIYFELDRIHRFWFPPTDDEFKDYWFSSEHDSYIKANFYKTWSHLSSLTSDDLIKIVDETPESHDKKQMFLGIVVCLDQFTRNLIRTDDRSLYAKTDDLCMSFVQRSIIWSRFKSDIKSDVETDIKSEASSDFGHHSVFPITDFNIRTRIFVLLPYRHQRKTPLLDFVMLEIQHMDSEIKDMQSKGVATRTPENILNRFKLATIKDYSKVTDTIIHYTNTDLKNDQTHLLPTSAGVSADDTKKIRKMLSHVLDDVCLAYSLLPVKRYNERVKMTSLYIETLSFVHRHSIKNVCISLSGGVDSMALSYILCHLRADAHITKLCAVHLDYGNRQVSRDEAVTVEAWCAFMGIPLITRRIEHIKRHDTTILTDLVDRNIYETETKNMRFNLYKQAMKLYGVTSVMLGHHNDDLSENVLMNVLRGGDILNLFTMKEHQVIDGVPISRPMLKLQKSKIYDVAHAHEVPYVKDTTPGDCFRGTVRKTVLPALEKIDPAVRLKINTIGNSSDQWNNVVNASVIHPVVASAKKFKFGIMFEFIDSYKKMTLIAWQKVLSEIFHSKGVRMITNRNLMLFMKWIDNHPGFIRFSNDHMGAIYTETHPTKQGTSYMIFVRNGIASHNQELDVDKSGRIIPIRSICDSIHNLTEIVFNGWTIRKEYVTTLTGGYNDVVKRRDFERQLELTELMDGKFSYLYRTCEHKKHSARDDSPTVANITYSMGAKESDNKRFFKGHALKRYTPFVHFGVQCTQCRSENKCIVYRITYSYT
ncbi:putative tRNA(Ile)lysidine synthase [Yasminevirus sp. GU-2018]|uniref:tRNA(Ile)-lysidine synthetase n=1 Tax=Yasminevirus sp. GU-2018 TaxID=2420051 RepID=A0A5K0UAH5_9VIRU|nr:putative tRNA(Ile)lysidine synthase [Yasminevirus sp. GU-2018]